MPICTANGISHRCHAGLKANRPNFDLTLLSTRSPHSAFTHSPIGVGLSVSTNNGNSLPFSLFLTRNNLYAFGIYHHHLIIYSLFHLELLRSVCTIYYSLNTAKCSKFADRNSVLFPLIKFICFSTC